MQQPNTETVIQRLNRIFGRGTDTDRIAYFSDAVFAIAMTLLVLDLRLPGEVDPDHLWAAVFSTWPQLFAYALSFVVLGVNWIYHHRKFRVIVAYDAGLIWINLVFLMFVALLPFPTSLLSEFGSDGDAAVVLYAGAVGMLSALQMLIWSYAGRKGFLSPEVTPAVFAYTRRANIVTPAFFWASIPVVLLVPDPLGKILVYVLWFLSWPVSRIVDRIGANDPAEPVSRSRG